MPHTPQRLCKAPLEECLPIKLHFMEFVKHFSRFFLKNFCPTICCVFRPRNAQFLTTAVKKIKRNRRILANDREFTDDGGRSKPLPYVKFYGLRQTAPAFNFAFASAEILRSTQNDRLRRGGAICYELAVLGISAVLGKAVARRCTYCTASGD